MKYLLTFLFSILAYCNSYAQVLIKGQVKDESNFPIPYFHVALKSASDSIIKHSYFYNGHFSIEANKGEYFLSISSAGFNGQNVKIRVSEDVVLDKIILVNKSVELNEIVVKAEAPRIRLLEDKLVVNIENTTISDAGTALDVLKRTPLIMVSNDGISVAGKGNTLILLNGRQLRNTDELNSLNSSQIKEVEVIENPSAKYEADGHAIINIITVKKRQGGVYSSIYTRIRQGNHFSYNGSVEVSYQVNKIQVYGKYSYDNNSSDGLNYTKMKYELPTYQFNSYLRDSINTYKSQSHNYLVGVDYSINDNHNLGVQFNGYNTDTKSNYIRFFEINRNGKASPRQKSTKSATREPSNYMFNFNYKYSDTVGYELTVLGDYSKYDNNNTDNIEETNDINSYLRYMRTISDVDYDLYSVKVDGVIPLNKTKTRLEIGAKYSYLTNNSDLDFLDLESSGWVNNTDFSNKIVYSEQMISAYLMLTKRLKKWSFTIGVRNENNWVKNHSNSPIDTIIKETDTHFFPTLAVNYNPSEKISLRINYSKRISRPNYRNLNNTLYYLDSLSTRQGNPYLKPTLFNTFSSSIVFNKKITLGLSYSYIEDPVDMMFINDKTNIEQYTVKYNNTNNTWQYGMNISGSFRYKIWSTQPYVSFTYRPVSITDDDVKYSFKNPSFFFTWNNQLNVTKTTSFDINFNYYLPGGSYMKFGEQFNIDLGMRQKLMKDKLTLTLTYYGEINKWTQYYNYSYKTYDMTYDGDRHYVQLSARFNLTSKTPSYKKKSASDEEQRRM